MIINYFLYFLKTVVNLVESLNIEKEINCFIEANNAMIFNFTGVTPLFAQGDNGGGPMSLFLLLGPVLILFWFFLIRPQQREDDRRKKMLASLKKNDKVYTVGGIIGIVHTVDLEKKEIVLKLDDSNNTKVKFLLNAIAAIVAEPEASSQ